MYLSLRFASCTLKKIVTLTASTFIVFQDGNAAKSSQKLRHPGTQSRQTHASQGRGSSGVGDARLPKAVGEQRPRKVGAGPRQSKGQTPPISARVPAAPLQLRWFPGNQVLDGAYLAMHCSRYYVHPRFRQHSYSKNLALCRAATRRTQSAIVC